MFTTRALSDQHGQFVILPAELAYDQLDIELEISRHGDVVIIRPANPPTATDEAGTIAERELPTDPA